MDLIGIGAIAAFFAIWLAMPGLERRRRRREMGLQPELPEPTDWAWPPRGHYRVGQELDPTRQPRED